MAYAENIALDFSAKCDFKCLSNGGSCYDPYQCDCQDGDMGIHCEDKIADVTEELRYCYVEPEYVHFNLAIAW